jgi:hypothetical protein
MKGEKENESTFSAPFKHLSLCLHSYCLLSGAEAILNLFGTQNFIISVK